MEDVERKGADRKLPGGDTGGTGGMDFYPRPIYFGPRGPRIARDAALSPFAIGLVYFDSLNFLYQARRPMVADAGPERLLEIVPPAWE